MSASDLIAEAGMLYGWSVEYIFKMPATRFFKLMESGRRMKAQQDALEHVALCDIQTISLSDFDYYQEVRKRFYYRGMGREEKNDASRALDPTDQGTVIAIKGLFSQASKLHG